MTWKLAPGVGFCRAGDDLLFLDLKRDRYFALGAGDRLAFDALCARTPDAYGDGARLEAGGLICAGGADEAMSPPRIEVPHRDIHMLAQVRPSPMGIIKATASLLWAKRAAAAPRILRTVSTISERKAGIDARRPYSGAAAVALHFEACRPFAPVARRCLIDSLALMRLCLSRGIAPTLVFGVRTEPFAAHCWLQHEEHILTCPSDDVLGFTPILVV